jgi:hypothetical protein
MAFLRYCPKRDAGLRLMKSRTASFWFLHHLKFRLIRYASFSTSRVMVIEKTPSLGISIRVLFNIRGDCIAHLA